MDNKFLLCSAAAALCPWMANAAQSTKTEAKQPNIILIMVDDMGYSDIGCYGSEIPTPNIDALAGNGVRYTQFYNTARSCPTRGSLLTGLYPHQAGIGEMSEDPEGKILPEKRDSDGVDVPGYMGFLNRNCVTMAEVLRTAGYHTYMVGKWHVGMHEQNRWPLQRGFDRYYGILAGATSYLRPAGGRGLTLDNTKLPPPEAPYYTTDAFTDYAIQFMDSRKDGKPFFLYVAYNAPHWPLQAKQADIDKFKGAYDAGWEAIREARQKRMVQMGLIDEKWGLAEWESRHWSDLTPEERANSSLRMSVYAAQISCVDQNVGRITEYLKKTGQTDNTIIVFLSDNGACAEPYSETGFGTVAEINNPSSWVHPSYGLPWAQVSNTPYRKYKVRAYEGGICTPLIFSWPAKYASQNGQLTSNMGFLPDLMATFVDASGATYPTTFHGGNTIHPMAGKSLLPALSGHPDGKERYLFGEHFGNRYVRCGKWKAVKDEKGKAWELYDVEADRTEKHDLAGERPELLADMVARWDIWANNTWVFPKRK